MERTCTFPSCDRVSRYKIGLCDTHYTQRQRGRPLTPIRSRRGPAPALGGPCSFEGCVNKAKTGGLCSSHYRHRSQGRPLTPIVGAPGVADAKFWSRVTKTDGCWSWTGPTVNSGYGAMKIDGKNWLAHRYSYTQLIGPLLPGWVVDHLCRNRLCVRPDHLRQASHTNNVRAQGLRSNNRSGVRGVHWDAARGKWSAKVNVGGQQRHVGRFGTLEDAAQAVAAARARFYREFPG